MLIYPQVKDTLAYTPIQGAYTFQFDWYNPAFYVSIIRQKITQLAGKQLLKVTALALPLERPVTATGQLAVPTGNRYYAMFIPSPLKVYDYFLSKLVSP